MSSGSAAAWQINRVFDSSAGQWSVQNQTMVGRRTGRIKESDESTSFILMRQLDLRNVGNDDSRVV